MTERIVNEAERRRIKRAEDEFSDAPRSPMDMPAIRIGIRLLMITVFLITWEYVSGRWIEEYWVSRPTEVWAKIVEWWQSGDLVLHMGITSGEAMSGFLIGTILGGVVGFIFGWYKRIADILDPFIIAIYSLPKVALAPLFIIWFGIGFEMKVILTAVIVFFLVFFNTYSGVRDTSRELIDIVRLMGAKTPQVLWWVVLPSALTAIFVGLRISVPYALIGAVVGEMMASNRGVGFLLMQSAGQFDTAGTFAALLVLIVISAVFNETIRHLEAYLLRWKDVQR
ncbi:ABC transporter permease [Sneathiella sp.]|uniref:ABC transporter permease n=1 Tax=Sneathiella sp. TaxID=1964365 RepID=UPI003568E06C